MQDARKEFKETAFELHFQERVDMGHVEIDGQENSPRRAEKNEMGRATKENSKQFTPESGK